MNDDFQEKANTARLNDMGSSSARPQRQLFISTPLEADGPDSAKSATFLAELNRESDGAAASRSAAGRKLATIGRRIDGIVGAIAEGIRSSSLASKLASLETERDEIKGLLDAPEPMPVQLHPDLAALCRAKVATLATALGDEELRTEAFEILRSLIEAVVLHPAGGVGKREAGQGYEIELVGEIARMVAVAQGAGKKRSDNKKAAPGGAALSVDDWRSVKLVAGT